MTWTSVEIKDLRGKRFSSDNHVIASMNQWFTEVKSFFFQVALKIIHHR